MKQVTFENRWADAMSRQSSPSATYIKRIAVDRTLYQIDAVSNGCFNEPKNPRRVVIRHGKTTQSFLGLIDIESIGLWIRHLSI